MRPTAAPWKDPVSLSHMNIYIKKYIIYIIKCAWGRMEEEKRDRDLYHLKSAASF